VERCYERASGWHSYRPTLQIYERTAKKRHTIGFGCEGCAPPTGRRPARDARSTGAGCLLLLLFLLLLLGGEFRLVIFSTLLDSLGHVSLLRVVHNTCGSGAASRLTVDRRQSYVT
jgi:hypothetical protein